MLTQTLNTNAPVFNQTRRTNNLLNGFFEPQTSVAFSPSRKSKNFKNTFFSTNAKHAESKSYENDSDLSTCEESSDTEVQQPMQLQTVQLCCKSQNHRAPGMLLPNLTLCKKGKCCGSVDPKSRKHIKDMLKYKTEMCRQWSSTHTCNYGHKCQYAHSTQELRAKIITNKNFKTKKCPKYHTYGQVCTYGIRCKFIHGPLEFKSNLTLNQFLTCTPCKPCPTPKTTESVNTLDFINNFNAKAEMKVETDCDDDSTVDTQNPQEENFYSNQNLVVTKEELDFTDQIINCNESWQTEEWKISDQDEIDMDQVMKIIIIEDITESIFNGEDF